MWFPVRLLLNTVEVKWLFKVPLTGVMVINNVVSISMMGNGVVIDDVVIHMEVNVVVDMRIMVVIVVVSMVGWFMPVCKWVVISMMHLSTFNIVMFNTMACLGCNVME